LLNPRCETGVPACLSRARRIGYDYLLSDHDDYDGDPFLGNHRRREEILKELSGIVLEHEVCGVRIYRFTR